MRWWSVGLVIGGLLIGGWHYRHEHPVSMNCADLVEMDLSQQHWARASLASADLRFATLCSTDLRGADLSHACLQSADLRNADLRGADLHLANLDGADLRGARLDGATLALALYSRNTLWPDGFDPMQHHGRPNRGSEYFCSFDYRRQQTALVELSTSAGPAALSPGLAPRSGAAVP